METTISSSSNEKIKYVRALERRSVRHAERRFVIEGTRLLDEALRAGMLPALVLYTAQFAARGEAPALLERLRAAGAPCYAVAPHVMESISDTVTPPGILAVMPFFELPAPPHPTLILVADGIATPGNLGTLLRSAEAAGVDLVLLSRTTTDYWGPKVVRGGMGAHFRLPVRSDLDWPAVTRLLGETPAYLAEAGASLSYDDVDWRQPAALIIGSEAHGPTAEARRLARASISIPMRGAVESLNAGIAGSVILFEAARQRRRG
jgi:TrmH family RNA methyltransferase